MPQRPRADLIIWLLLWRRRARRTGGRGDVKLGGNRFLNRQGHVDSACARRDAQAERPDSGLPMAGYACRTAPVVGRPQRQDAAVPGGPGAKVNASVIVPLRVP